MKPINKIKFKTWNWKYSNFIRTLMKHHRNKFDLYWNVKIIWFLSLLKKFI